MKEIALTDAKARLSQVIDEAGGGEPTVITRHGRKVAVVSSYEDWQKATDRPPLWDLLMQSPLEDGDIVRSPSRIRPIDF